MIKLSVLIGMFFAAGAFASIDVVTVSNGTRLTQSEAIKECRNIGRRLPTSLEARELYTGSLNADGKFEFSQFQKQVKGQVDLGHPCYLIR